ncbi:DEAD/DEAH box helicase [Enterococcus faecium]|uniref:DEAD/DEAH box helicase n=1 Tax=Enterococcus faecium TaxID=1352 RepID=UPI002954992E|nr:DEAD/DEAH box helicase [Enterococcus faecium]MDV7725527.1 DEAD/DEAH box helicase [Enterococcus faecium]
MQIPRNQTLAEALYRDIDNNEYLNEIYESLLYNYSIHIFKIQKQQKRVNVKDALRFADLLAKSTIPEKRDRHKLWGQELIILLSIIYPEDSSVKYYLGSILSTVGNYRGLQSTYVEGFQTADVFDALYFEYDKSTLQIPGHKESYFFHDQKDVYDGLNSKYFSYSGPTSMGKSFVVQTYLEQQIENGSTKNYAILVPTKALINEVRSNIIGSLQEKLQETNYRVVSASGDIVLQQEHSFIFVMTPERLLHMMIGKPQIKIDFLFVDEAHKISDRGGRSTYYYKVIAQLSKMKEMPTVVFASPNIPNPEVYLGLIPKINIDEVKKLASKYTPVCQFKYFLDLCEGQAYFHNDYSKSLSLIGDIPQEDELSDIVNRVGSTQQNIIYCNSRQKVVDYAVQYATKLHIKDDEKLISLANDIRTEVHSDCYLADLIQRGVAYHVGYLPTNIRLRIEKSFVDGILRTIFCTSTLVEGVNLPADNLFITSYRNGNSNMDEVEFRNLVGRVGRIKYNLYGNVFLIRMEDRLKTQNYINLLQNDVPKQEISINLIDNKKYLSLVVDDLARGDMELTKVREAATEKDFDALRKFAMIFTKDIAEDNITPIREAFSSLLDEESEYKIKENFPVEKTSDDINFSYDQIINLRELVESGQEYPKLTGENDEVDFEELVDFLMKLRKVFKWDIYEKRTIGKSGTYREDSVVRWYAVILLRWIRGNGLSQIIYHALKYKEKNPNSGVWVGNMKMADVYNKNSKSHKNYIIAETLGVIENVLLFSISNYFRKFSLEYKDVHQVDHFQNDWYEYVEYGTTNPLTIFLQQSGFSRESSKYIEQPSNQNKYLIEVDGEIKIHRSILTCGNIGVETEAHDIQFNMPELFID